MNILKYRLQQVNKKNSKICPKNCTWDWRKYLWLHFYINSRTLCWGIYYRW